MTYDQYSPEWLAENCDPERAFEVAMRRHLLRLLAENRELKEQLMHATKRALDLLADAPLFTSVGARKLDDLRSRGFRTNGYAIVLEEPGRIKRGFITTAGLVGWWMPEGANIEVQEDESMTTLRQAAQQALEALEHAEKDAADFQRLNTDQVDKAIAALRQAIKADEKPCPCCGDGNGCLFVTRVCDTCGSEYAGQAEMDMAKRIAAEQQAEPVAFEFYNPATGHAILDYSEHTHLGHLSREMGYIARPLVRPQPAQQPLTDEEIRDVAFDVDAAYGSVIEFARAIERAHGIGGEG